MRHTFRALVHKNDLVEIFFFYFSPQLKGPFIATQLNSTRRRVELSFVAINGP